MYRPEIKVIDCTVRDGGLMNKWQFTDKFVRKVYNALTEAGVDYMEIGYLSSESAFSRDEVGAWKFCAEADLKRIIGDGEKKIKLSAMADIGRIDLAAARYSSRPNWQDARDNLINWEIRNRLPISHLVKRSSTPPIYFNRTIFFVCVYSPARNWYR